MDNYETVAKSLDVNSVANYLDGMALGRQYPLIDRILDGQLERRLRAARKRKVSYFTLAAQFTSEGFAVSPETVRAWCVELGIEKPEEDAS